MSLYIEFPVSNGEESKSGPASKVAVEWCKGDGILAVSASGYGIKFVNDEGEVIEGSELRRNNSCDAISLNWRIMSKVLAAGWEDGAVTLWNVKDRVLKEDTSVHASAVTVTMWSPEGSRLVTADKSGLVAFWRTDHRGRLAVVAKKDVGAGGDVTCCEWVLTSKYREAQRELASPPELLYVGTKFGSVFLVSLKGDVCAAARTEGGIRAMRWFEEEQRLVVISEDASLMQFSIEEGSSDLKVISKVKLAVSASASKTGIIDAIWTCPGLLATCAAENMVRIWDLMNESSYVLTLPSVPKVTEESKLEGASSSNESPEATCICFNSKSRILAVSTRQGRIHLWRFVGETATEISDDDANEDDEVHRGERPRFQYPLSKEANWETVATLSAASAPVKEIQWAAKDGCLAVVMESQLSVMTEAVLHRTLRGDVAAIQLSAQRILVQRGASIRLETDVDLRIKGLDVSETHVVVWSQRRAEVYEFRDTVLEQVSAFDCAAEGIALYDETLFRANGSSLMVCNLQGIPRKDIMFSEHEGEPKMMHVNGKYMAVATNKGMLKVFDVSRREPKPLNSGTWFQQKRTGKKPISIGEIRSIRCNCDGTRVSVISDTVRGRFKEPDTRIHVWNGDRDEIRNYDVGPSRVPVSHFWDPQEPRLLTCEAKRIRKSVSSFEDAAAAQRISKVGKELKGSRLRVEPEYDENEPPEPQEDEEEKRLKKMISFKKTRAEKEAEVEIITFFATCESDGVLLQDSFALDSGLDALVGVRVPRIFFVSKPGENGTPRLKGKTMRDFVGMDAKDIDDDTKKALIDFSYYLTIGNMDEAYRAVKMIENVSVWENMAHMCVKTRRLDVAEMCMGNMGHARGAKALRESRAEPECEVRIATVAIQLGLLDDAEKLLAECGRYDLLNKMLRDSGQWTKALEVANSFDRIHLRETHFEYARHLESVGDFQAAIANYEASGTHRKQVPRMLSEAERLEDLESYIQSQCDVELTKWWGQHCESLGEYERAIHVYQRACDEFSLVRLHCMMDNFKAAAEIALGSSDPAASFQLARHCEERGEIEEAIQFYSRAGRYNHAVRLAKEKQMDSKIVNLAIRSSKSTMIETAKYLESKGLNEDAVALYQKGGNIPRALDLCFRSELFDQLTSIADGLILQMPSKQFPESGSSHQRPESATSQTREEYDQKTTGSSPEILARCAEFFIEHKKFDKAVHLYITAGDFETSLELCFRQKVHISEEMAECMTLEKRSPSEKDKANPATLAKIKEHNERRQRLLESVAKCCKSQQSYHLATKKYTQAGDRVKAMKCLLRSGDTEKIIFFANHSRSKEIYVLAANYLQNLDWRNDPAIMKAIVSFYSKAKAYQQLSLFAEVRGQAEIDEYRDYENALSAFRDAAKALEKERPSEEKEQKIIALEQRIAVVERFVYARKLISSDPDEAERMCKALIAHPDANTSIRLGDIYAMLVEFHFNNGDVDQVHDLIERMKSARIPVKSYIDTAMLDRIAQAVGVDSLVDDNDDRRKQKDDVDVESGEEEMDIEEDIDWGHK